MIPQPIIPTRIAIDSAQQRSMFFEIEKIAPKIKEVEDSFIEELFLDTDESYESIYKSHSIWYNKNVSVIVNYIKPKWFTINKNYFSEMFAPLEHQ